MLQYLMIQVFARKVECSRDKGDEEVPCKICNYSKDLFQIIL